MPNKYYNDEDELRNSLELATSSPVNPPLKPRVPLYDPSSEEAEIQLRGANIRDVPGDVADPGNQFDILKKALEEEAKSAAEQPAEVEPRVQKSLKAATFQGIPLAALLGGGATPELLQARKQADQAHAQRGLLQGADTIAAALTRTKADPNAFAETSAAGDRAEQRAMMDQDLKLKLALSQTSSKKPVSNASNKTLLLAAYGDKLTPEQKQAILAAPEDADLSLLTRGVKDVSGMNQAEAGQALREKQFTAQQDRQQAQLQQQDFKNQMEQAKTTFDQAKVRGEALTKYQDDTKDYRDLDADLRAFYDVAQKVSPDAQPGVLDNFVRQYGKGIDTFINEKVGNQEKTALETAFGRLTNAYLKKNYGAALNPNEEARANQAINAGLLGSWQAKLQAVDLMRKAQGKALAGIQAAYADLIPEEQWNAFRARGGIAPLQDPFYGVAAGPTSPGLPKTPNIPTPAEQQAPEPVRESPVARVKKMLKPKTVRVRKGNEVLEIPIEDLEDARKDGYEPVR